MSAGPAISRRVSSAVMFGSDAQQALQLVHQLYCEHPKGPTTKRISE